MLTVGTMRLDKFLQLTGLVKRRTLAKALCDAGRVLVNDKVAKPAAEVRQGDILEGQTGWERWRVRVLRLPKGSVPTARRSDFVEVIERVMTDLGEG